MPSMEFKCSTDQQIEVKHQRHKPPGIVGLVRAQRQSRERESRGLNEWGVARSHQTSASFRVTGESTVNIGQHP